MHGRTIAAGIALSLLGLAAPQAHATGDQSEYKGGCGFDTLAPNGSDQWSGAYYSDVVLYSRTHGNVVAGTVTCVLRVNYVTEQTYSLSGTGAIVFGGPMTFTAAPTDIVELCTGVDYTSDSTPSVFQCAVPTSTQLVPQEAIDVLGFVVDLANYAVGQAAPADTVVCPVLQALAPGSGSVSITPEGDTYVDGDLYWDCPPYETPTQPPPDPNYHVTGLTGGGYDDGDTGFLTLLSPATVTAGYPVETDPHDVVSTCAFHKNSDAGTITVVGRTATGRTPVADAATIHCRLQDATGAVRYDRTVTATGPLATLDDTVAAIDGKVSVCTQGSGTWGTTTVTVGLYCRLA